MIKIDKNKTTILLSYVNELFEKTNILCSDTLKSPDKQESLVSVQLSEIFALCEKAKLYVDLNEEIAHHEINSLFTLFDSAYFQLKKVIEKDDRNTSWLSSTFKNYKTQHENVIQMLKGS
ncbi:hypothetical protein J2Z32_002330 [Paenibacillus turicensis]|uniref:Uncharacterized protein n=1 Tax=Paenibacillus turicensis TaxID=160487 RepID=A0ABS4FSY7_9BACL|nr:hypothetical protein [Paenibacillus turicensis]MBP1905682.1 hypothetical protein [Paenibacillus turicensis]